MSWSRGLGAFAALALAGALAGCFQPLYSEAAHPGLVEDLRAIEVQPIKDRIGHYLADNLTTDLNGTGQTPPPKYRLTVTVATASATPTVSSLTNIATSATMTGDATYTLNKVDGGALVLKGVASAMRLMIALSSAITICAPLETPRFGWRARSQTKSRSVLPRSWPGKLHERRARHGVGRRPFSTG